MTIYRSKSLFGIMKPEGLQALQMKHQAYSSQPGTNYPNAENYGGHIIQTATKPKSCVTFLN